MTKKLLDSGKILKEPNSKGVGLSVPSALLDTGPDISVISERFFRPFPQTP